MTDKNKWKVVSGILVLASGYAASYLVQRTWSAVSKDDPPSHPRQPNSDLKTAMAVAAISGIVGTALKFGITRFAGKKWLSAGRDLPEQ